MSATRSSQMPGGLFTLHTQALPIHRDVAPGVHLQPLFLDPNDNLCVIRVIISPGVELPTHYHTGQVHVFTLSGQWVCEEYPDEIQVAGSFSFAPRCSTHTITVPSDAKEPAEVLLYVRGACIEFDRKGNYGGVIDCATLMKLFDQIVTRGDGDPVPYITSPKLQMHRQIYTLHA